jgi:hypothetical protein
LFYDELGNEKKNDEILLASKGWQHYKSKGDFFIINPTKEPSDVLKDGVNYKSLELNEQLVKNLEEKHDITIASKIQVDTMREMFNSQHVLLAAQTGCGKVKDEFNFLSSFKTLFKIFNFRHTHFWFRSFRR